MKRAAATILIGMMAVSMTACGGSKPNTGSSDSSRVEKIREEDKAKNEATSTSEKQDSFSLKASPDKYTQYVDKYIGLNAANVGYTSMGGERLIEIGSGHLKITYVTPDGSYVGPEDEERLKDYVVVDQSIEPNTEVQLTFETDSSGKEFDGLVEHQSYSKIDLLVKKVGSDDPNITLTQIDPSPDKYTYYIQDYVGKNLGSVGYLSLGGGYMDAYGPGVIELKPVAEDGSFIDVSDETILQQYVVTGQNVAANSEMKYTFDVDSDGNEYSNLVDTKTYDSITLNVASVTGEPVVSKKETEADEEDKQEEDVEETDDKNQESSSTDSAEYKAIYDEYEKKLKDKTKELIEEYKSESSGLSIDKKAELVSKKTEKLAELSTEGVEKMAGLNLLGGADGYMEWSGKLYDVYMEQSEALMDEYMNTAFQ